MDRQTAGSRGEGGRKREGERERERAGGIGREEAMKGGSEEGREREGEREG